MNCAIQRFFPFIIFTMLCPLLQADAALASGKSNFSGDWILTSAVKDYKGKKMEIKEIDRHISIFNNAFMLQQEGGRDPGAFKIDNKWHKVNKKKTKVYWSLKGDILYRQLKYKKKTKGKMFILEMRTLEESGKVLKIDRRISSRSGFFKSVAGFSMPDEDYDIRELLIYRKE